MESTFYGVSIMMVIRLSAYDFAEGKNINHCSNRQNQQQCIQSSVSDVVPSIELNFKTPSNVTTDKVNSKLSNEKCSISASSSNSLVSLDVISPVRERLEVEVCMGMGNLGIPWDPWDSHGNGKDFLFFIGN